MKILNLIAGAAACVLLLALLVPPSTLAMELWTYTSEKDIKWYQVTPPGIVVFSTDKGLHAIDPASGEIAWEFPECRKLSADRFEPITSTPYALIYMEKKMRGPEELLVMVDLRSGAEAWNSTKIGISKAKGCILLAPIGGLLVYGERAGDQKGKLGVAADLQTGNVIWQKENIFDDWEPPFISGNQPAIFDSDSTMILFLNKKSVRKYDIRTGDLIWETTEKLKPRKSGILATPVEEKECAALTFGYAPMAIDEELGLLFAPYQNSIAAFRLADGSSVWPEQPKIPGAASQVEAVPQGVLVRAVSADEHPSYELLMLDKNSGSMIWKAPSKKGSIFKQIASVWVDCTNFIVANGHAYTCVEGRLRAINLDTGEQRDAAKLEFKNSEKPRGLERLDSALVAAGPQNASWFDLHGNFKHHVYFEPPENVDVGLGLLAAAFAVNQIGGVDVGGNTRVSAKASYSPGLKELMREFSATAESEQHLYFLTYLKPEDYSDPGLVKVDKRTGERVGELALETKEPDYRIDLRQGRIILRSEKKSLKCYQF